MLKIIYRLHAIEIIFEREIDEEEVEYAIKHGETIDSYPDDEPYESCLVNCLVNGRNLHVVYARNFSENIVVTVYEPSVQKWEADFKIRKK